jgi:type IV secretory pathway VirB2 component (pilin)
MSIIAVRRLTRRLGRRVAGMFALLCVLGAVGVHHSGVAMDEMHHDGMAETVLEVCLGALSALGAVVAAVAIGMIALGRWPLRRLDPAGLAVRAVRTPSLRPRAGPSALVLLCVSRS